MASSQAKLERLTELARAVGLETEGAAKETLGEVLGYVEEYVMRVRRPRPLEDEPAHVFTLEEKPGR